MKESTAFLASCMHCPNWLTASGLAGGVRERRMAMILMMTMMIPTTITMH